MSDNAAEEAIYVVPEMSCGHCKHAISGELASVAGVTSVEVDLDSLLPMIQLVLIGLSVGVWRALRREHETRTVRVWHRRAREAEGGLT